MIYTIDMLINLIESGEKKYDKDVILRAYQLAEKAHAGQCRESGAPYVSHPVAVAYILVELGMDTECICAALLHDVVEDTDYTLEQIEKEPTGCTTCAPFSMSHPKSSGTRRWKPWKSTPLWPTAWGSAPSRRSWRTSPCIIWIRWRAMKLKACWR